MRKVIAVPLGWLFKSVPGVALLVIALGVGVAYAATNDNGNCPTPKGGPQGGVAFAGPTVPGVDQSSLSEADRKSLQAFGECMRDKAPQPGADGKLPDPSEAKDAMDAAFDSCKTNLSDSLQQRFERNKAQAEEYQQCLEDNGAPKPPDFSTSDGPPKPPSSADIRAMQKAQKACEDKRPEGDAGMPMLHVGPGPGGPGAGGPGPGGPPPVFGASVQTSQG